MSKHTPGPWEARLYANGCYYAGRTRDGWGVLGPDKVPDYECPLFSEADARLIAAAPELLANLIRCAEALAHCMGNEYEPVLSARAAIAKATKEQREGGE